jgi:iron complex outermembrane receptor protein
VDLGFAELTSATGYSRYADLGQRDQTDLLITLAYSYEAFPSFSVFTRDDQTDATATQELRLVSQGEGPSSWIAGLFYLDQQSAQNSREFAPHYDQYLGGVLRPDSLEYISALNADLTERGVFGEFGYEITDAWAVTVGGRFYDYEYGTESGATVPLFLTAIGDLPPDEIGLTLEPSFQEDDGFLFKLNTSYRFTDDMLGYATISEGYRVGAANGVAACPDPLPVNQIICALPNEFEYFADNTTNYELGLRSQWLDKRLTFNSAVYFIDWQDPQLLSQTVNGAQPITINGEGAESLGLELSFALEITDRLSVGVSYAQTKAELTKVTPDLLREFTPPGFGPSDPAVYVDGLPGDRRSSKAHSRSVTTCR